MIELHGSAKAKGRIPLALTTSSLGLTIKRTDGEVRPCRTVFAWGYAQNGMLVIKGDDGITATAPIYQRDNEPAA